jgi:hypothetical protein
MLDETATGTSPKSDDPVEGEKLFEDFYKHLTTLNTGAILLLSTILEKAYVNPQGKFFIAVALVCFIISSVTSSAAILLTANHLRGRAYWEKVPPHFPLRALMLWQYDKDVTMRIIVSFLCWVSFLLGLISLTLFALVNFF